MKKFSMQLSSDAIRLSKTPFFIVHLAIPVLGILVFTVYQSMTIYPPEKFTVNYYQVLTLIYPLLAAWICSIITEQDVEAGGGFLLLSAPSRMKNLLSELIFLILGGLVACLIVTLGYSVVAVIRIPGFSVPLSLTLCMALLIWGCAVFEYLFHTWLGFQFGRNVSFAVAAAEILFSALMLTGLGETIWFYVPSAWGVRLVSLLSRYWTQGDMRTVPAMQLGIVVAAIVTLLMLAVLFVWFHRWEGRKNDE
ncbi:lantibiotic immunity ABC transporter MutG family permease subunit [Acetobacterium wieringae]|uniref:Lantibiotic immunity ABC transporter MutG family permease subunit n=1 Tax=Acetobacterium wieringae TaxID=52694 RepID=A0ABY6HG19_9FIRM|nr:lantibiotic immunity ABC transporter MutG family permease subunit [Acetobacterium wieringae]UYO63240.1 lantibiotic immunity ABC transporter MutG family permease subunit [Acetobacterium wieringae]VUZ23735.1 Uncharacterised protein [Acetobacterium wieringae]